MKDTIMCAVVVFGLIGFGIVDGLVRDYIQRRKKPSKNIHTDASEFSVIGEQAIREQKMKSFIIETEIGDEEVINDDI